MKDVNFEFKYIVKHKPIDNDDDTMTIDGAQWDKATKKIVTVQLDDQSSTQTSNSTMETIEQMHIAKRQAIKKITELLNDEFGVDCWRFFD